MLSHLGWAVGQQQTQNPKGLWAALRFEVEVCKPPKAQLYLVGTKLRLDRYP